jgi:TetR/AcrR family transcriptional regulator, regulator of cefoperazone and chloramphenicol sensitivity
MGDGRERLLDAAERLIAVYGVAGVSLRQIASEAGQGNVSAVQYHFGSKEGLVDAILYRRMLPIDDQRKAMVRALDDDAPLAALVDALVLPYASAITPSTTMARFMAQALGDPGADPFGREPPPQLEGYRTVMHRINGAISAVPRPERVERLRLLRTLVVGATADREQALASGRKGTPPQKVFLSCLRDAATAIVAGSTPPWALGQRGPSGATKAGAVRRNKQATSSNARQPSKIPGGNS